MTSTESIIALCGIGIFVGVFVREEYRVALEYISIIMMAMPMITFVLLSIYHLLKKEKVIWKKKA